MPLLSLVKLGEGSENGVQQLDQFIIKIALETRLCKIFCYDIKENWSKMCDVDEQELLYRAIGNCATRLLGMFFSIGCHPIAFENSNDNAHQGGRTSSSRSRDFFEEIVNSADPTSDFSLYQGYRSYSVLWF